MKFILIRHPNTPVRNTIRNTVAFPHEIHTHPSSFPPIRNALSKMVADSHEMGSHPSAYTPVRNEIRKAFPHEILQMHYMMTKLL